MVKTDVCFNRQHLLKQMFGKNNIYTQEREKIWGAFIDFIKDFDVGVIYLEMITSKIPKEKLCS